MDRYKWTVNSIKYIDPTRTFRSTCKVLTIFPVLVKCTQWHYKNSCRGPLFLMLLAFLVVGFKAVSLVLESEYVTKICTVNQINELKHGYFNGSYFPLHFGPSTTFCTCVGSFDVPLDFSARKDMNQPFNLCGALYILLRILLDVMLAPEFFWFEMSSMQGCLLLSECMDKSWLSCRHNNCLLQ